MQDTYRIRTPENVEFVFPLAGVGARAVAWLVDVLVIALAWGLVTLAVLPFGMLFGGLALALHVVLAFVVEWGYRVVTEWKWGGQTLGKRAVGLRVLSTSGMRITFGQAVVRNLVRIVDLLPALYLAGGAAALCDRHGRRLGDLAAGTVVVRERRAPRPATVRGALERDADELSSGEVRRVVDGVTPPERDAMVALALRRDTLPLPVRVGLFSRLAGHLVTRFALRRSPHASDEKLVLGLAAAMLAEAARSPEPTRRRTR